MNFQFFTIKGSSPLSLHCFISHLFLSKTLFFPHKKKEKDSLNTNPIHSSVLTFVHRDMLSSLFYCVLFNFFFLLKVVQLKAWMIPGKYPLKPPEKEPEKLKIQNSVARGVMYGL